MISSKHNKKIVYYPSMVDMSYQGAGVDIDLEEKTIKALKSQIGTCNGIINANGKKLVLCTDGVGSKILIANAMRKWDTIGIDCMAMNVNDALCLGAKPLAFVDYLAMETINPDIARAIAIGLQTGADMAGVTIIGGETATLPDIITGLDLAGTCLGIVIKDLPREIYPGDYIIGLKSSGIHSNGYTLVRKVLEKEDISYTDPFPGGGTVGDVLLTPTQIYVKEILDLMQHVEVKGLSHITGGGLRNLKRLSKNVCFSIDYPFKPHKIFQVIQRLGNVSPQDMYQTFNMGMGFAIIVSRKTSDTALDILKNHSTIQPQIVGKVIEGHGVSLPSLDLHY
jgi:phosphoribosylformylglycinamidine cyclo-ligase